MYISKEHDCSLHCDRPGECHQARRAAIREGRAELVKTGGEEEVLRPVARNPALDRVRQTENKEIFHWDHGYAGSSKTTSFYDMAGGGSSSSHLHGEEEEIDGDGYMDEDTVMPDEDEDEDQDEDEEMADGGAFHPGQYGDHSEVYDDITSEEDNDGDGDYEDDGEDEDEDEEDAVPAKRAGVHWYHFGK